MSHDRPRAWLVSYDIRDPRRLRRVYDILRGYGDHLQYSVFRCVLTPKATVLLEAALLDAIHADDDQVLMIDLGDPDAASKRMRTLGQKLMEIERVVRVIG